MISEPAGEPRASVVLSCCRNFQGLRLGSWQEGGHELCTSLLLQTLCGCFTGLAEAFVQPPARCGHGPQATARLGCSASNARGSKEMVAEKELSKCFASVRTGTWKAVGKRGQKRSCCSGSSGRLKCGICASCPMASWMLQRASACLSLPVPPARFVPRSAVTESHEAAPTPRACCIRGTLRSSCAPPEAPLLFLLLSSRASASIPATVF